jgi:hypothetical protein
VIESQQDVLRPHTSPLALDLDRDGVELVSIQLPPASMFDIEQ